MNNMESEYESALYFAALKLIQQLCADGLISEEMFHEILNENADNCSTYWNLSITFVVSCLLQYKLMHYEYKHKKYELIYGQKRNRYVFRNNSE